MLMYKKYSRLLRIVIVSVLTTLFVLNSNVIFEHYISGKTITSSSILINPKEVQMLPAIIICREKAYNKHAEMFHLSDYLDNTMTFVYYVDGNKNENGEAIEDNSTFLRHEWIYSYSRGYCVVLKYIKEVIRF